MNLNQCNYKQYENLSQSKGFTSGQISAKFCSVVAKSTAERGNSNNLYKANITSTPKNRAIFVCDLHTSKESNQFKIERVEFLSMVACNGQGFALDCFPCIAVFPPRYTLSPYTVESVSDSSSKFIQGLSAMIYLFKAVSRLDLRNTSKPLSALPNYIIRIQADTLEQAKAKVCPLFAVKGVVYA